MVAMTLFEGSKAYFSSPSEVDSAALFYDFSCLKFWERMDRAERLPLRADGQPMLFLLRFAGRLRYST